MAEAFDMFTAFVIAVLYAGLVINIVADVVSLSFDSFRRVLHYWAFNTLLQVKRHCSLLKIAAFVIFVGFTYYGKMPHTVLVVYVVTTITAVVVLAATIIHLYHTARQKG